MLENLLSEIELYPMTPISYTEDDFIALDLSTSNKALQHNDLNSSSALHNFIQNTINRQNGKVAYGGYLEERAIYKRSKHFTPKTSEFPRNIHLGVDIWCEAHTPIYAPLNGIIHSFNNNNNYGDYGPTIILKHELKDVVFYTLYGHLSLPSLKHIKQGEKIAQGQQIASLGTSEINGDYPPHLHFQIIKDIGEYTGDYPGVCSSQELDFFKMNCPDPVDFIRAKKIG